MLVMQKTLFHFLMANGMRGNQSQSVILSGKLQQMGVMRGGRVNIPKAVFKMPENDPLLYKTQTPMSR